MSRDAKVVPIRTEHSESSMEEWLAEFREKEAKKVDRRERRRQFMRRTLAALLVAAPVVFVALMVAAWWRSGLRISP